MRRLLPLVAATLLAACSKSPCQELGEKLCSCTGIGSDSCKTQVQDQLDAHPMSDGTCDDLLKTCSQPEGADFCEWLLTCQGKVSCGIATATSCTP